MKGWPTRTQVLIIGAGPTGLTLGITLRQRGIDCLIVDKLPAPLPWSRALGLHARTQEILDALGVQAAISERSLAQRAVSVYGDRGPLFSLDLTVLDAPYPQVLSCPQAEVEACLANRFAELGGVLVRDCTLQDFTQDDDGVVAQLYWAAGDQYLRADVMVGCDGAGSRVRDVLGISFDGVRYPDHFLLADLDIEWDLPRDSSHGFLLGEGALIAIPLPQGWRLIINQSDDEDLAPQLDIEPFRERLNHCLDSPPELGPPRWLSRFSIHRRLAGRYRRNRVLLAGDACHIQSPLGAQGMNTGIGDAFNLGWKLAAYLQGHGDGRLLDSYEQERRPVARQMLTAVDLLSKGSFTRAAPLRRVRDGLLRLAGNRPQLGARLVRRASQLDVNYRHSPIVARSSGDLPGRRDKGPLPGDRVPDVALRAACTDDSGAAAGRLHDSLRSGDFQLLIQLPETLDTDHAAVLSIYALLTRLPDEFGGLLGVQLIAQGDWPAPLKDLLTQPLLSGDRMRLWCHAGEAFAERFGNEGRLWLVRPDGHLAFRGLLTDADELVAYLSDLLRRRN